MQCREEWRGERGGPGHRPSASPECGVWWWCSVARSCLTLCDPWTVAQLAPLSMGFSRQEYWSGLPFPSPGDLPDPGMEPASLVSPALAGGFFATGTAVINKLANRGGGPGSPWL